MLADMALLHKKNKEFKKLSLLPGFNLKDTPKKVHDILSLNNNILLSNNDIIDEKIFMKFFGVVDNSKEGNVKKENKKTRKKRGTKDIKDKKDTKKEKKDKK